MEDNVVDLPAAESITFAQKMDDTMKRITEIYAPLVSE